MRSILAIAQEAAERSMRADPPTTLFDTNERVARILRVAAHDVSLDMMRRPVAGGWSTLHSTWVFRLEAGVGSYRLPPDYGAMIPGTEHRETWNVSLLGPAPARVWHQWLYGLSVPIAQMGWRVQNGRIYIEPVPSVNEFATIGYLSRWPVVNPVDGADYMQAEVGADEAERVTLPLVTREGYLGTSPAALGMTESEFTERFRLLTPTQGVDVASEAMARKERFTADIDWPVMDDHVLSLGMTARLLRALEEPYADQQAEYEEALDVALADDAGGARDVCLDEPTINDPLVFLGGDRVLIR